MEGVKNRTVMEPLTPTDLVVPLSQMVKKRYPDIDLLVAVVKEREPKKAFDIAVPLADNLGVDIGDVCCLSSRFLPPHPELKRRRILTTHGNADVEFSEESFEINIHEDHLPHCDKISCSQLTKLRNTTIHQLRDFSPTLTKRGDAAYPDICGNVVLCGDFSIWDITDLLALREIFIVDKANEVIFVTPVIRSGHHRTLTQEGCNVVCLRPLKERQIGLAH